MKPLFPSYELSWRTGEDDRFMKSAAWKRIRQQILTRDNFTCTYCGFRAEKGMQVNHIDGVPKNNADENLEVICPECHMILHAGLWVAVQRVVCLYRRSKYSQNDVIRITREMRASGKSDQELINLLGLEEPMPWMQNLEYLRPLIGFIMSGESRQTSKPHLSEDQQKEALKNRKNW